MSREDNTISAGRRWAALLGLAIALGSPFAVMQLQQPTDFTERVIRGSFIWGAITLVVLVIATAFERQPLSSLGFKRFGWGGLGFGLLGMLAIFLTNPLSGLLLHAAGGKEPTNTFVQLGSVPIWVLAILPFRAAITEEVLFRGYAMTRIEALTGSRILAFILPTIVFCIAHAPVFGVAYALAVTPLAIVLGVLFLWRRNLWANMIAHAGVDAIGLSLTWALAHGLINVPPSLR